ncbi:MAG: sugar phosphate isomerase/epimerase family protein [Pirellulaceae bacterium]
MNGNNPSRFQQAHRRGFFASTAVAGASALAGANMLTNSTAHATSPAVANSDSVSLRYCLNTSTINGSKVPLREQLQIAAKAGYDSVELWLRDIEKYLGSGGTLTNLASELEDLGLSVESAIAFGAWIADDDAARMAGLDQCRKDMETLAAIGGKRIAAPPKGATDLPKLDLDRAAERYHALLEVGADVGVLPQLELWGFSKNLSTLQEILYVAAASGHPDACILLDVYHMYKGGNDFNNVGLIPASKMFCLHMNDYPADPPRETIGDADRVYPGDGVAPLDRILKTLVAGGFSGTLSLELFNRSYWKLPPLDVASTGLAKMKAAVDSALGSA